ncbi:MAG: hypothetical protein IGS39_24355 [Calothrix sp. C42_A2020_038]|nr:hypothetical protein [Calothrix sp. C42_A2020_038]
MATPQKPTQKKSSQKNLGSPIVKRIVTTEKKSKKVNRRLTSLFAITILFSITSVIVGFAWVSFLYLFQPQQVVWINKLLPQWAKIDVNVSEAQTLAQIEADLSKLGLHKGEVLPLNHDADSFLLSVYKKRANCQFDCQEIIELRVYQQANDSELLSESEKYYNLTTQVAVAGPEESFVIAPLVNTTNENPGSSISLPLTEIKRLDGNTSSGIWYCLLGRRQEGIFNISYGHIFYYNPARYHIQQLISWTSPKGELPEWQQVTGNNTKELVINQTTALEPQLQVYQVKSVKTFLNPVELDEIRLQPPAFKDSAYEKALVMARSGLWTPAYDWLKIIKKRKKNIPPQAQAQIDLIRLHSQISKTQADTTWASPGQQVLANLIDGRWSKALEVFKATSPQNSREIGALLKTDSGRLWSRLEAALLVNSNRPEVQAWGALILAAQYGDTRAYLWLKQEFQDKQINLTEISSLLKKLKGFETVI